MKLSFFTALVMTWVYGTIAGLLLPHGPLALSLYGLALLAVTGAVQGCHHMITHQLALAEFRREMKTARHLAAQAVSGGIGL